MSFLPWQELGFLLSFDACYLCFAWPSLSPQLCLCWIESVPHACVLKRTICAPWVEARGAVAGIETSWINLLETVLTGAWLWGVPSTSLARLCPPLPSRPKVNAVFLFVPLLTPAPSHAHKAHTHLQSWQRGTPGSCYLLPHLRKDAQHPHVARVNPLEQNINSIMTEVYNYPAHYPAVWLSHWYTQTYLAMNSTLSSRCAWFCMWNLKTVLNWK